MKQLPTLAISIPHRDHLAVVIPMKLGDRVYDHSFVLVLSCYCKVLSTTADARRYTPGQGMASRPQT